MKKRILSMLLALTMLLSLVPTTVFARGKQPEEGKGTAENPIKYVSIGDSMTNGYGFNGYNQDQHVDKRSSSTAHYDGTKYNYFNGTGVYGEGSYALQFEKYLAEKLGKEVDYRGHSELGNAESYSDGLSDGVDHIQMATSAFRVEELVTYLGLVNQFDNRVLPLRDGYLDNNWAYVFTNCDKHRWVNGSSGNWSEVAYRDPEEGYSSCGDIDYLEVFLYNDNQNRKVWGEDELGPVILGPNYNYSSSSPTGYTAMFKYLTNYYKENVASADIISLHLGNAGFDAYFMDRLFMIWDSNAEWAYGPNEITIAEVKAQLCKTEAEEYIVDKLYASMKAVVGAYISAEDYTAMQMDRVCQLLTYVTFSYMYNYKRAIEEIGKLNPDAEVMIVGMLNSHHGITMAQDGEVLMDMGEGMGALYDLMNTYVAGVAADYMEKTEEFTGTFYFVEQPDDPEMIATVIDQLDSAGWNKIDCGIEGCEDCAAGRACDKGRLDGEIVRVKTIPVFTSFFAKPMGYWYPGQQYAKWLAVDDQELLTKIQGAIDQGLDVVEFYNQVKSANNVSTDFNDSNVGDLGAIVANVLYLACEKAMVKALESSELEVDALVSYADGSMVTLLNSVDKTILPTNKEGDEGWATVHVPTVHKVVENGEEKEYEITLKYIYEYFYKFYTSEEMLPMLRFFAINKVGNGIAAHPTPSNHDRLTKNMIAAYENGYTVQDKCEDNPAPIVANEIYVALTKHEPALLSLDQTLAIMDCVVNAMTGDAGLSVKTLAIDIYEILTRKVDVPPVPTKNDGSSTGTSSSGSDSELTPAEKLAVINTVYAVLNDNGILADATQVNDIKDIFEKLEADEDAAVKVFETLFYGVLEPETAADIDVAGISASVYNTVMSSDIDAAVKMEIIEDVADLLAESQLGVQTGLPTDKLAVIKALREALKDYFTAEQLGVIIADISALIMDGEMTEAEKAALADNLHNNYLFGRDDLSAADKAEIIMIVYNVLDEYGLVESAAMGALAYAYLEAVNKGYLDAAIKGLQIAQDAIGTAKDYVNKKVPAEYAAIRDLMIEELDNTAETLSELEALLQDPTSVSVADLLALEDDLWNHLDTLKDLGLAAGVEIDPYLKKINKAVVEFNAAVEDIIDEAYAIISAVKSFPEAYAAWVESVGAKVDAISPELGALVRKYLNDNAADAMAILAVYGDEAVAKLVAEAVAAYGEIADVVMELFYVLSVYGEKIYEAVENNPEVDRLVEAVKAQLAKAEILVKEIEEAPFTSAYEAYVADKEAALDKLYTELTIHYNELQKVLFSVIDDVDEDAANALSDSLEALKKALCITYGAADGYLGWLADHADAMACELLCALLENTWEFICAASPIVDQVMYDWLYNNPETVIAFFVENGAEIEELIEKYGPAVVGVIAYIGATYGPEVLDFIINNPCEALDMFMDWYNKYGYRIWPMIDVYLEALGVYDAIDEQLEIVKAMLSELDAHILAQIAALKAALLDASEELRAQIEAEIEALYEQLMAFLKANISAYYVVGPNSYYVALGDAGAYGPAADKLAAELGMTDKFANLTFADASAGEVLAMLDAAEIAKADLITLGFSANTFTAAVAADVMNAVFGEIVEKDWAALVGEEGAAAIEAALAELTAYVAEEVEDEAIAALLTAAVESFAYTYINHLVDYVVVSEAIHEINADALLVLVGMHNPMDGVVIDLDGEQLDLGEYLNYLVMLTNIYSFGYALIAEDTIYVDAPAVETNYDGAVMDIMTFVTDLLGFEEAVVKYQPTDAGYKYIQEQIYNALNPTLAEEEEACQHTGKVLFTWNDIYTECKAVYVCSACGLTETKDCLVKIEIVKQPTEEETGLAKHTATVEFFGKTYSETKEVVLPKLDAPDTGDTTMIGLYVTVMLFAAAGAIVVLKKKKHA